MTVKAINQLQTVEDRIEFMANHQRNKGVPYEEALERELKIQPLPIPEAAVEKIYQKVYGIDERPKIEPETCSSKCQDRNKPAAGTSGWIKLHRQIQDNPLWKGEKFSRGQAWIDLLLLSAWEPRQIWIREALHKLERGELAASARFLAKRWGWGLPKVAKFLALLTVLGQIEKIRNGSGNGSPSVYRIVNYDIYQADIALPRNGSENACGTLAEQN